MNTPLNDRFAKFVEDQSLAIDEFRTFISGEVAPKLDGSLDSLALLDMYIANLTVSGWENSALFNDRAGDRIVRWLTVRVAYYLASCLQQRFGASWQLSSDSASAAYMTPILAINDVELSPLEIADACIRGELEGGLAGLARDLENELRR